MFLQQQFTKIHVCSKRRGKPLKLLSLCVCVCVILCVSMCVRLGVCISVCVSVRVSVCFCVSVFLSLCVSMCVSKCVSAINLCVFKYNVFVLRILLVPVLVQPLIGEIRFYIK